MQLISLFSGIGGFELAAEWAGITPIVSCEINPFGRRVLEYYWPNAYHHDDIHTLNYQKINAYQKQKQGANWRASELILAGGFPCQPFSVAGKQGAKDDERYLWPEMLRIIREVRPTWVVGENVAGIINLALDEVCASLESEGYEVQSFVIPACAVDAPHRRDRVWIVGHTDSARWQKRNSAPFANRPKLGSGQCFAAFANAKGGRWGGWPAKSNPYRNGAASSGKSIGGAIHPQAKIPSFARNGWEAFPTQSPICGGNDGLSTRLDGITFPKWRNESIKAYGNAIVPQVAYQIFEAIKQQKTPLGK